MLEQVNISRTSQGALYPKTPQNPSAFSAGSPALVGVCRGINTHSPEKGDIAREKPLAPELAPGAAVPSPSPHLGKALGDCQGYLRGGHRLTGEGPWCWSIGERLGDPGVPGVPFHSLSMGSSSQLQGSATTSPLSIIYLTFNLSFILHFLTTEKSYVNIPLFCQFCFTFKHVR